MPLVKKTARRLKRIQKSAPIQTHASAISLNILFALFPTLLVIVAIFGLLGTDPEIALSFLTVLETILPHNVHELISEGVLLSITKSSASVFSVGFLILIWAVSKTVRSIRRSLNDIYHTNRNPNIYTRFGSSFLLAIVLGLIFFLLSNLVIWGNAIAEWLSGMLDLPGYLDIFVLNLHWPIIALLTVIFFVFTYRHVPNHEETSYRDHLSGALFATLVWIIGSLLFNIYINRFKTIEIYGTIGAFIVLILYIQVTVYAFLGGAFLNSASKQKNAQAGVFRKMWHIVLDRV